MKSEEINLKELGPTKIDIKELNKEIEKNIINSDESLLKKEKIQKIGIQPLIQINQISFLSESIINYCTLGICFFIYGCYGLEWFKITEEENKSFYIGYFLIAGIIIYIIGLFNWYEGKELIFLIDFIFSFLFISLYLKNKNLGNISDYLGQYDNDKINSIFYIILFCFIFVIGISSKEKGIIYIINNAVLFITYVFLFAYEFYKKDIFKKIDSYMFIVCGALFWITGIFKFINNLMNNSIIIFEPSD